MGVSFEKIWVGTLSPSYPESPFKQTLLEQQKVFKVVTKFLSLFGGKLEVQKSKISTWTSLQLSISYVQRTCKVEFRMLFHFHYSK